MADSTRANLYFQNAILFINNILIPCIASTAFQSNCFYHLLSPPPAIYSSYLSNECYGFILTRNLFFCTDWVLVPKYSSYIPPFTYSYQCTGSLLKDYASAFVYVNILNTVFGPLLKALLIAWRKMAFVERNDKLRNFLDLLIPPLLRKDSLEQPITTHDRVEHMTYHPEEASKKVQFKTIFNKTRFVININCLIAILLTFGAVFPPVAVVSVVCILSNVLFQQYCIGWFVRENIWSRSSTEEANMYRSCLNQQIKHIGSMISTSLYVMMPFVILFYLFFVFDMIGSTNGFVDGIIGCGAVIAILLLICLFVFVGKRYLRLVEGKFMSDSMLVRIKSAETRGFDLTDIYSNPMH